VENKKTLSLPPHTKHHDRRVEEHAPSTRYHGHEDLFAYERPLLPAVRPICFAIVHFRYIHMIETQSLEG